MEKRIAKATYQFEIPFLFCGREYWNSAELAMALIEHWDLGLMAAKRGEIAAFFDYHAEFDESFKEIARIGWNLFDFLFDYDRLDFYWEDIHYATFLTYMEKNLPGVPVIRFGELKGELMGKEELERWSIGKDEERKNYGGKTYDEKLWDNYVWVRYKKMGLMDRFFPKNQ